jgi:hypothetical protein
LLIASRYFASTNFDPRRTTRAGLNPSGAKARNLICVTPEA